MKYIKLTQGHKTKVDNEDFEKLNKYKWYAYKRKNKKFVYAVRISKSKKNGKRSSIFMHQVIMNTPKGMVTDHIDGNGINNQKKNLRICTKAENTRNRKIDPKNTSGYKGVSFVKKNNNWKAQISVCGHLKTKAGFSSPKKAYNWYCQQANIFYKEYARFK